ncbi:sugar transferase [Novosphingobium sp. BL-8A]
MSVIISAALFVIIAPSHIEVDTNIVMYSVLACVVASSLSVAAVNNVRKYPGVEERSYILPAFSLSYGVVTFFLIFSRIPYSRFVLISSFLVSIILFGVMYSAFRKRSRLSIGVVPEGGYARLTQIPGIDWRPLDPSVADATPLDAVSADLWADLSDAWERRLASYALQGTPVYHSKHLLESLTGRVEIEHLSENTFGTLSPLNTFMAVKRIMDLLAAILAIVVLFPFLLVVGLLIRLDSKGPALFLQTRVGYRGRPFRVFKFRTMASEPSGCMAGGAQVALDHGAIRDAAITKDGDKRITRLGQFLRRSRIDELPQILNVLRGEMSWIGPRPEAHVLSQWYEQEIPFYRYRHIVRPGITGWAQVNQGHVADVDQVQEKLHFDFYYIKNFSLWIDIVIIARTIITILTGFGSK